MTYGLRCVWVLALVGMPLRALAWSDHAGLLWPLVRSMPELTAPSLQAEPLGSFVAAEADGLADLLAGYEAWAQEALDHYAPLPGSLAFHADAVDPRAAFLAAIRVNPTLAYGLHRQVMVEDAAVPAARQRRFPDLSFLAGGISTKAVVYEQLAPGDGVSPAHVIATASDEPDFGMDIGLFEDNETPFGVRYGFGTQPFGNPNLDYSSQAPFHMGFYHLDWMTRKAQPDLLRTFPEYRVSLYRTLGLYAFRTGHDYWGWRFLGWALHYVGDLTQPYHADPLPGVSTIEALWQLLWGKSGDLIQLVSNRHGVIESYQYQRVQAAMISKEWNHPVLAAIADHGSRPTVHERLLRDQLTAESVDAGADLDGALEQYVPPHFVSDPGFEWTGSGEEPYIVDRVRESGGAAAVSALDAVVASQLQRFSRYAGAWIEMGVAAANGP